MIYAGQEYGERGMDSEGFSGHDGRTTIFDYWSVDTLVRAYAGALTASEQALYDTYRRVLDIAQHEKAVTEGLSYDLMYANTQYHRTFMFIRKSKRTQLLVVANFDDAPVHVDVHIPAHAFDFLQLRQGLCKATDLMSGASRMLELKSSGTVGVDVEALTAVVYKLEW